MTWQRETCIAPNTYQEALTSWVAVMTSKHVSAVAVNAGGTGHVVGDVITITHASAYHDLRLEVTAISGGVITAVRINTGGAFAERLASASLGASGGSGYAVGDILEVQGGSATEKAKVEVLTLSGSAVATVGVFETGGAYGTAPGLTDAVTEGVGPAAYAGDDLAVIDLTMQAIIGTTGIAQSSTSGSGISATFDLTLTDTGFTTRWNKNEATSDSVTDNKEVVLQGTVAGADEPFIGFFTYRADSGGQKRYGIACFGMTAWNSGLPLSSQPGIGPIPWEIGSGSGSHILVAEEVAENNTWAISVTGRRITGFIRGNIATESDSYHTFYIGLKNGFGATATTPYPMAVMASSNQPNRRTSDFASTGLSEAFQSPSGFGPIHYLRKSDLSWVTVRNAVTPSTELKIEIMWPRGVMLEANLGQHLFVEDDNFKMLSDGSIGSNVRANVVGKIYPTPGSTNIYTLQPLTVISSGGGPTQSVNTTIVGELDGVFFAGGVDETGTIFTPEDEIEQDGDRYILIPASTESLANRPYQFMAFRED
jgi:hypothetical protein